MRGSAPDAELTDSSLDHHVLTYKYRNGTKALRQPHVTCISPLHIRLLYS